MSKVGKVKLKMLWDKVEAPTCGRSGLFLKSGLALGLGLKLGLAFQGVKMSTFDGPDGVQIWENDEKVFLDKVGAPKCGKSGLLQRLGLGLAFQDVKISTMDGLDDVRSWESDEKSVLGKSWGPKVWKKCAFFLRKLGLALGLRLELGLAFQGVNYLHIWWTRWCAKLGKWWNEFGQSWGPKVWKSGLFSKVIVSVRVRVRVRISFSRCEDVHFWWTRGRLKLGKWWKKVFWTKLGPRSVEEVDFFQQLGLALGLRLELGLAFQGVEISTFDGPDDVRIWESDEKLFLDKIGAPRCGKSGLFSKGRVSVWVTES